MQQFLARLNLPLDGTAIAMSAACIVHCLFLPVLIALLPILGATALADQSFHILLLALIIPTSGLAFYLGCREHGGGAVLWLGGLGIGTLAVAAWLGVEHLGIAGEKLATAAGGTMLAAGHVLNFRRCRARRCEENAACRTAEATA